MNKNQAKNLDYVSTTPKFLREIKEKLQRANQETQKKDFEGFLANNIKDKNERETMMKDYLDSFEDEEKIEAIKYRIMNPEDELVLLKKQGFSLGNDEESVGGAIINQEGYENERPFDGSTLKSPILVKPTFISSKMKQSKVKLNEEAILDKRDKDEKLKEVVSGKKPVKKISNLDRSKLSFDN